MTAIEEKCKQNNGDGLLPPPVPSGSSQNDSRTELKSGTPVTRGCSGPVRYELIDKDGRRCGTYPTATAAGQSAQRCWPLEQQDSDRTGAGWDVQVCENGK